MAPPTLHVIYAGRGDAMILECDEPGTNRRQFILVDGGPLSYHAGNGAGQAPYQQYLRSACRDLMPTDTNFAAVIISHPDEDHFGGYTHNLHDNLMNKPPVLFIPSSASSSTNDNHAVEGHLKGPNRGVGVLPAQQGGYLIAPVRAIYPPRTKIQYFFEKITTHDDQTTTKRMASHEKLAYNSGTTTNNRSILMYTPGSAGEMGIFFTGDSHADIIAREMTAEFPNPAHRRFAVYKIQHHGSIYDNQLALYNPYFRNYILYESFIYGLLNVYHDVGYLANPEEDGPSVRLASRVLVKLLRLRLKEKPNKWTQTEMFYESLSRRIKHVQKNQLETLRGPPKLVGKHVYIEPPGKGVPALKLDSEALLEELDDALRHEDMPNRARWKKFRDNLSGDFMTYLQVRNVKNFYLKFEAEAYVVSANAKYNHPRCETLLGLALAVRKQERSARLYVTNAQSIDVAGLRRLVEMVDQGDMVELFNGNYLRISYLGNGTYMSLRGESQRADSPIYNVNHDINNMTQEINFGWHEREQREYLHHIFEKLPDQALLKTVRCQIVFLNDLNDEHSFRYLYPHYSNGELDWSFTEVGQVPRDCWMDLASITMDPEQQNRIRCRVERFGALFEDFICMPVRLNLQNKHLWHIKNLDKKKSFYREVATGGTVRFGKANGNPLVEFYIDRVVENVAHGVADLRMMAVMPTPAATESFVVGMKERDMAEASGEILVTPFLATGLRVVAASALEPVSSLDVADVEESLRKAFQDVGDSLYQANQPTLMDTLSRLFRDKDALYRIWMDKVPDAVLHLGLAKMSVDLDASTARVTVRPVYGRVIRSATLVCQSHLEVVGQLPSEIEMGGFHFKLGELRVIVTQCLSPDVTLGIEASVSLHKATETQIELSMAWTSSAPETALTFTARVTSLQQLVSAISSSGEDVHSILEADIPLTESVEGHQQQTLGKPSSPMQEIGFTLVQPTDSVSQCELADIWVRMQFPNDWKSFLPHPEKFEHVKGEATLRVLHPFSKIQGKKKQCRIAAAVHLVLPIPESGGKVVTADFCAIPLPRAGDYQYQFRIDGVDRGITVRDIAAAIGLGDISDKIVRAVPELKNVYQEIQIRELGISVCKSENQWAFDQWVLELYVPTLEIIQDILTLSEAALRFEKLPDELRARGEATFRGPETKREAVVSFALPTADTPGYVAFNAPGGLLLGDIFTVFQLGDLSGVPVLGGLATVELISCEIGLARESARLTVSTCTAAVRKDYFSIGSMELENVQLSVSWHRLVGSEATKASTGLTFELSALLKNLKCVVKLTYNHQEKKLSASLSSTTNGPLKVIDLIGALVPGVSSALHDTLDILSLEQGTVTFDVNTLQVALLELTARGTQPWTGNCCGVSFVLHDIGLRLQIVALPSGRDEYASNVFLDGRLVMPGFVSVAATLHLQRGKDSTLMAILEPSKEDGEDGLMKLADNVHHERAKWRMLAAQPTPLQFSTGAQLLVNFTTDTFFLRGSIENVGSALLLAKRIKKTPSTDGYGLHFDLVADRINQIWHSDALRTEVTDVLQIKKLQVKVLTFDGTASDLKHELEECDRLLRDNAAAFRSTIEGGGEVLAPIGHPEHSSPPSSPVTIPIKDNEKLTVGASFIAEIGLDGSGELLEGLRESTNAAVPPTISLLANISQETREYRVFVQHWQLVDDLLVINNASGTYIPLAQNSQGSNKAQFNVSADINVSGLQTPLNLQIEVHSQGGLTLINGEINPTTISKIFDGMFGVNLSDLQMNGRLSRMDKILRISGEVTLGSFGQASSQSNLRGVIRFKEGKPRIAVIEYESNVQVKDRIMTGNDVFSYIIASGPTSGAGSVHWPHELPALNFKKAFIYYNSWKEFPEDNRHYKKGFWLGAELDIFDSMFEIQAHITDNPRGLIITGELNQSVDLGFVQFIGHRNEGSTERTRGPSLLVEAQRNPSFLIWTGVEFLKTTLPDIKFGWDGDRQAIKGTVPFTPFDSPDASITFLYKDGHCYFEDWKVNRPIDFNINDAIKEGSKGQHCEEIVEKVFKQMVKSTFHFTLNMPEDNSKVVDAAGQLHLEVPWTCEISALEHVVGTVLIKRLPLSFGPPWAVKDIWGWLAKSVEENIKEIGIAIMADPSVFGKLLALIGFEKLALETLNRIFCRKVRDPEWTRKIRDYSRSRWKEFEEQLQRVHDLIDKIKALLGQGKILALADIVTLMQLLVLLLALIPLLFDLVEYLRALAAEAHDDRSEKEMNDLKNTIDESLKKLKKDHREISDDIGCHIFQNAHVSAQFAGGSDDTVTVTWNKIDIRIYEGTVTFTAMFATNDEYKGAETVDVDGRNSTSVVSHTNPEYRYAPRVYVRLEAHLRLGYEDGQDVDGLKRIQYRDQHLNGTFVASHVALLRSPTNLGFRVVDTEPRRVEVSFDVSNGTRYEIQIYAASSKDWQPLHKSIVDVAAGASHRVVSVIELCSQESESLLLNDHDTITFRVRAVSTDAVTSKESTWVECPSSIPAKRYVRDLTLQSAGPSVIISWKPIDCREYRIRMGQSTENDKWLLDTKMEVTDLHEGRLNCLVAVPNKIPENTTLYVAVEAVDVPVETCPLATIIPWIVSYKGYKISKDLEGLIDIQEAIRKGSLITEPPCHELSNLQLNRQVHTRFDWSVELAKYDETQVEMRIAGTFTALLQAPGPHETSSTEMAFPSLGSPLQGFSLGSLPSELIPATQLILPQLGRAILNQKEKASVIVSWIAVKDLSREVATALVHCGIDPPNVYDALKPYLPQGEDVADDPKSPGQFWKTFSRQMGDARALLKEPRTINAVLEAIGVFTKALATYESYQAVVKDTLPLLDQVITRRATRMATEGHLLVANEVENYKRLQECMRGVLKQAGDAIADMRLSIRSALTFHGQPTARFSPKTGAVHIDWKHIIPIQASAASIEGIDQFCWEVVLSTINNPPPDIIMLPTDNRYHVQRVRTTSCQTSQAGWVGAHEVHIWIRARFEDHDKLHEPLVAQSWTAAHLSPADETVRKRFSDVYTLSGKPTVSFRATPDLAMVAVEWTSIVPRVDVEQSTKQYGQVHWDIVITPSRNMNDPTALRRRIIGSTKIEEQSNTYITTAALFVFIRAVLPKGIEGDDLTGPWAEGDSMTSRGQLPEGFDLRNLGQVLDFLSRGLCKELPPTGVISDVVWHALQNSLRLPEPQETMVRGDFVDIVPTSSALEVFERQSEISAIRRQISNEIVQVQRQVDGWWDQLQIAAHGTDHPIVTFQNVLSTVGRELEHLLNQLQGRLICPPGRSSPAPIQQLRDLLESEVTSTTYTFAYDTVELKATLERWTLYLSGIQAKGVAMCMMYEKFRLVRAMNQQLGASEYQALQQSIVQRIQTLNRLYTDCRQQYSDLLSGGVLAYPSAQLLLKLSTIDLQSGWPPLYALTKWDSDQYLCIDVDTARLETTSPCRDRDINDRPRPNFSHGFAFARTSSRTWTIRGSRFDAHPEGRRPWVISRGPVGEKGLFRDEAVECKIVPHPSGPGMDPRVTLVLLNHHRNLIEMTVSVSVQENRPLLPTLAFDTASEPERRLRHILGRNKRVLFWINNLTTQNYVLVLEGMRAACGGSHAWAAANCAVWLRGQRNCVGFACPLFALGETDLEVIIKLRVYRLQDGMDASQRHVVEPLLYQDPNTGCLSLRSQQVYHHANLYIRIWNPSGIWRKNYVSATTVVRNQDTYELGPNWTDVNIPTVSDMLSGVQTVQKESKEHTVSGMRLRYDIGGSDGPDGSIDVRDP